MENVLIIMMISGWENGRESIVDAFVKMVTLIDKRVMNNVYPILTKDVYMKPVKTLRNFTNGLIRI